MNVHVFDPNASIYGIGSLIVKDNNESCFLNFSGSDFIFNSSGGYYELSDSIQPQDTCLANTMDTEIIRAVYDCSAIQKSLSMEIPLATGDLDDDGFEDIIGIKDKKFVTFLFREGSFEQVGSALGKNVLSAALKDVNGDESLDAIIGQQKNILIAFNDGNGIMTPFYTIHTQHKVKDILSVDIDNDGDNDIIATGGSILVYQNQLSDGESFVLTENLPAFTNLYSIITADINNDGQIDIIGGGRAFIGNGDGTFDMISDDITKKQAEKLLTGDFDADGDTDLMALLTGGEGGSKGFYVQVFSNNGQGIFNKSQSISLEHKPLSGVLGDLDNDGDLDAFIGTALNQNNILLFNDGTGLFASVETKDNLHKNYFSEKTAFFKNAAEGAVIFDAGIADGDLDIVIGSTGNSSEILVNEAAAIHRNNQPLPPAVFHNTDAKSGIELSWNNGYDKESSSIHYFLRVGTASKKDDIVETEIGPEYGLKTSFGNLWYAHSKNLPALPTGTYYWSVASADNGFKRSIWSTEQSFTISQKSDGTMILTDQSVKTLVNKTFKNKNNYGKTSIDGMKGTPTVNASAMWYSACPPAIPLDDFSVIDSDPTHAGNYRVAELDADSETAPYTDFVSVNQNGVFIYRNNGDESFNRQDILPNEDQLGVFYPSFIIADLNRDLDNGYPLDILLQYGVGTVIGHIGHNPVNCYNFSLKMYSFSNTDNIFNRLDFPNCPHTMMSCVSNQFPACYPNPHYRDIISVPMCERNCIEITNLLQIEYYFNGFNQLLTGSVNIPDNNSNQPGILGSDCGTISAPGIVCSRLMLNDNDYSEVGDIETADFNGDGHKDIIVAHYSFTHKNYLLLSSLSDSNLKYQRLDLPAWTARNTLKIITGDFDNDGDTDILEITEGEDAASSFSFVYQSHLSEKGETSNDFIDDGVSVPIKGYPIWDASYSRPVKADFGDFDLDGKLDILMLDPWSNALVIYQNVGPPNWFENKGLTIANARDGKFIDFDNDGDLDILCTRFDDTLQKNQVVIYKNKVIDKNEAPKPPASVSVTRDFNGLVFHWQHGNDRETPSTALTYNLTIFEPATYKIAFGTNLGPEFIIPQPGNMGYSTTLKIPLSSDASFAIKTDTEYQVAVQSVDTSFRRSDVVLADSPFNLNRIKPAPPEIDPPITPTNIRNQSITGHAMPGTTIKCINQHNTFTTVTDDDGNFSIEIMLNVNHVNELVFTAINMYDDNNHFFESEPVTIKILQDSMPPAPIDKTKLSITSQAKTEGVYTVTGSIGALTDYYPTDFGGSCSTIPPENPCKLPDSQDCYYYDISWNVYDGITKISEGNTPGCVDGSFSFTFDIGSATPENITFVILPSDIAGNSGMYPTSLNLQLENFWREAKYIWLGKFSGTANIQDCGCPCSNSCGFDEGGEDDCVTCNSYTEQLSDPNEPFYMIEFNDGSGFIAGSTSPSMNLPDIQDYYACHREHNFVGYDFNNNPIYETTTSSYIFMKVDIQPATCFTGTNQCYPFGGNFFFSNSNEIMVRILPAPGELIHNSYYFEYNNSTSVNNVPLQSFMQSPILGLYPDGFYGFLESGLIFNIPNVTIDNNTGERSFNYSMSQQVGNCEDFDEVIHYDVAFNASAIRLEPQIKYLAYYKKNPESCAEEFTVHIDYPSNKYNVNFEIQTVNNGGEAHFQSTGTTTIENVTNLQKLHIVPSKESLNLNDIRIVAHLDFGVGSKEIQQSSQTTEQLKETAISILRVESLSENVYPVDGIYGYDHFVMAKCSGDVILQGQIDPDTPETREQIRWEVDGVPFEKPNNDDKLLIKISADQLQNPKKIPIRIMLRDHILWKGYIWVVWADILNKGYNFPIEEKIEHIFYHAYSTTIYVKGRTFTAYIKPKEIFDETKNIPQLDGYKLDDSQPAGTNSCGNSLTTGATYRWDMTRTIRLKKLTNRPGNDFNPNLDKPCVDYVSDTYPSPLIGNDDTGIAHDDEDPYRIILPSILVNGDAPNRTTKNYPPYDIGSYKVDDWFLWKLQFEEFVRLEIQPGKWIVISDPFEWRFHIKMKYVDTYSVILEGDSEPTTVNNVWIKDSSTVIEDNNDDY